MAERLEFFDDHFIIKKYPFFPSFFARDLTVSASEILEADLHQCVVRLKNDLIYLPDWPRETLSAFCLNNRIKVGVRYDVWAHILDPFVDTSYNSNEVQNRNDQLRQAGFSAWRTFRLRLLFAFPILLFQGIAGEWTGLYHYHLLYSLRSLRLVNLYGLAYRFTMKIALEPYHRA